MGSYPPQMVAKAPTIFLDKEEEEEIVHRPAENKRFL